MSKFDIVLKKPKDKGYCRDSIFNGFLINSGRKNQDGEDIACERLALCALIEQVQHIHRVPGYRWNAAHMRLRTLEKKYQHLPGREAESKRGPEVLRAAKKSIEKKYPNAKIHYRWHLEHSDLAGWHYHVAIFMNGNELNGVKAIQQELRANGAASVDCIKPDFSRVKDPVARDYFISQEIKLEPGSNLRYLPLLDEIDFEYAIYWFSYMTKKATKNYIGRSCGGTQIPKKTT